VEGDIFDHLLFTFSISPSVPEILAIEVWSCQKSCRILDSFFPPKYGGLVRQHKTIVPKLSCLPRFWAYDFDI